MEICALCKESKEIYGKGLCRSCIGKVRYKENIKKLREDPEKYKAYLDRQNAHRRKRKGLDYDKNLDLTHRHAPRGAGTINNYGYRRITMRGHPNAQKHGWILEHVYVMSEYLKRPLYKHERVHHKNGIRHDNRIENLELWSIGQPPGQKVEDKIKWCKEFLSQYENELN